MEGKNILFDPVRMIEGNGGRRSWVSLLQVHNAFSLPEQIKPFIVIKMVSDSLKRRGNDKNRVPFLPFLHDQIGVSVLFENRTKSVSADDHFVCVLFHLPYEGLPFDKEIRKVKKKEKKA
ncbi:MAG: hypothetical protein IK090_06865 [Clostridia bacterium]|nr:hypothetical protein [Clostridia bacterium]